MTELIHHLFNPLPNAIMTVLMIISFVYWLFSFIVGGIDNVDIDINSDFDIDVDVDAEVDIDTDADIDNELQHNGDFSNSDFNTVKDIQHSPDALSHSDPSIFVKIMHYMNIGKVPFMIVLTLFKFFTWAGTLIVTTVPKVASLGMTSVIILIPLSFVAIFFTHYATTPIAKFLHKTGYQGEVAIDFIGKEGKMISSITADKRGNLEVIIDNDPVKLLVESNDGTSLTYGDRVLIINKSNQHKNTYTVRKIH